MSRLSFRQLLFGAFLLIASVLTATSVQALLTLERLAKLGRETAAQAVLLTERPQQLAERTLVMERSARQFLVLDDTVFRDRYYAAWQDATRSLDGLAKAMPQLPRAVATEWTARSTAAWEAMNAPKRSHNRQSVVYATFTRLAVLNETLATASKHEIAHRNDAMLNELDHQRSLLTSLVAGAVVLAAVLATWFGFWLSRPLRRIKLAIEHLGQNRLDQAVLVGGPADTQRLGQQLDWLRTRLADLDAVKERFLRHISHELKTPLAALREGVALLEDEVAGPLTPGQREIAAILRQNTASLQTQIEDLLRYNTAAFDAQHLQRSSVDLTQLLRRVVDDQRLQWQARGLRVAVDGAPLFSLVDPDKLSTALANVLSNAVRFSPEGGTISFQVGKMDGDAGGGARIDCIDQGPGVARQDEASIFEPFYQGERQAAGARNGNGIGLSIVREYVAAHHGTVSLVPGASGAHFRIELPAD